MSSAVVSLGTLCLVLVNLLFKAAVRLLIVCALLFLISLIYPFLARVLGLPFATVYELVHALWNQNIVITLQ